MICEVVIEVRFSCGRQYQMSICSNKLLSNHIGLITGVQNLFLLHHYGILKIPSKTRSALCTNIKYVFSLPYAVFSPGGEHYKWSFTLNVQNKLPFSLLVLYQKYIFNQHIQSEGKVRGMQEFHGMHSGAVKPQGQSNIRFLFKGITKCCLPMLPIPHNSCIFSLKLFFTGLIFAAHYWLLFLPVFFLFLHSLGARILPR